MTRYGVLIVVAAVLTGCTSFYSSSIAGHDSPTLPLPTEVPGKKTQVGFDLKTSPTGSIFTSDSTQSILGTAFVRQEFWDWGGGQFGLQGTVSEYYSLTTLFHRPHFWSSEFRQESFSGFGTVVGLKPSLLLRNAGTRSQLAINALYNQEMGDYQAYRATLEAPGAIGQGRVNLSPHGRTASVALEIRREFVASKEWRLRSGELPRWTLGADFGYVFFDWPYSRDGMGTGKVSFLYSWEGRWVSVSAHVMPPLNLGVSLGIGGAADL